MFNSVVHCSVLILSIASTAEVKINCEINQREERSDRDRTQKHKSEKARTINVEISN